MEAATGVNRTILRPDLYVERGDAAPNNDTIAARAQEYALVATMLAQAPDAEFLNKLGHLSGDASPLGAAHGALAHAASEAVPEKVEREFFDLFIGVGRGELLPYASYYLTGFLHESVRHGAGCAAICFRSVSSASTVTWNPKIMQRRSARSWPDC